MEEPPGSSRIHVATYPDLSFPFIILYTLTPQHTTQCREKEDLGQKQMLSRTAPGNPRYVREERLSCVAPSYSSALWYIHATGYR
jgi:hypothetical protein